MPTSLSLPMLKEMIPGGLSYGANYLVEFEPQSLWYETSLTIAAEALKHGIPTDYHTFMHVPSEIKDSLSKLGLDIAKAEGERASGYWTVIQVRLSLGLRRRSGIVGRTSKSLST